MKLSVWAKQQGLSYKTAWRMWKLGQLPMPAEQLPTGTVIIHPPASSTTGGAALYARVSSADQSADLDRQLARLGEFAASRQLMVVEVIKDIGHVADGNCKNLLKLLKNPDITTIVVEHKGRLMSFGIEYVEAALAAQGRKLMVADINENKAEVVEGVREVMEFLCVKLYDKRSAKNRADRAIKTAMEPDAK